MSTGVVSAAPISGSTFAKPTSQPGTLFSTTAQPATLFGGTTTPALFGTTPNFSAAVVSASNATGNTSASTIKPPASSASMFSSLGAVVKPSTPTFATVSASNPAALNFSMTSSASVANTGSATPVFSGSTLFSGLTGIGTSVTDTSNKISLPALSATTVPNFQSMNLSTTKPVPQNVSTSLNTSVSGALVAPKNQVAGTATFAVKPMVQPLLTTPKDVQPISVVPKQPSKPDILTNTQTPVQQSSDPSAVKKDDTTVVNSHAIELQIRDEIRNFHGELQELFHRCRNIDLNVGTDEEKSSLVLTTNSLMEFYKELQETTDSLTADVHYLKQAVMQSFAWYEDTKSRQRRYTDPNYANLLQTQELDPFSEKQLMYIKHLIFDIESQLKQVDGFLDNQWAEFQDACKKQAKERMQLPVLEPIYQSLVRQNAILDKQRYVLKDIASRIKTRSRKAAGYPSVMNINLTNSNQDDLKLDEELSKLKINDKDIFAYKYERIIRDERKFTHAKHAALCEFFCNRSVVHIAPKKPKWLSSPVLRSNVTSLPTYITSPHVQRSLNQTFDHIAQNKYSLPQANNVETNISSSNVFNFSLLEASQTKLQQPAEKIPVQQKPMFNMPNMSEPQVFKPAVSMTSAVPENTYSMKYSAPSSITVTSAPVFSFTGTSSNVTQSKPQYFTSNAQSSGPVNFSLGSNITITPVSLNADRDKPSQAKSNNMFSFSPTNTAATIPQNKTDIVARAKVFEAKKETTKSIAQPEATLIKPNVVKTTSSSSATTESTFFGGMSTPEGKASQPFNFTVPQAKTTPIAKEPTGAVTTANTFKPASDNIVQGRDSLDTAAFSFGKALSLGQQSTPKPKANTSLMFGQGTVSPPITVAPLTSSSAADTQKAAPKPAFSIPQTTVPVSSKSSEAPVTPVTTAVSTPVVSKVETVSTTTELTTSLFGNVCTTTASAPSLFKQPSIATTNSGAFTSAGTSSLFSGASVSTPASSSIFGQQVTSTVSTSTPTPSTVSSIFAQAISTPAASTASIFGNNQTTTGSLFGVKVTTPQAATSLFAQKTENNNTTSASSTSFSFVQSATSVSAAELPKTTSIFGGAVQTTSTGFGTATTTTGFSFLQPANTTSTTQQAAAKAAIFSSAGETKPTETVSAPADKSSQEATFGFDSLAVSSADNNKFSFGNLTVSALSPNANTTTAVTTGASTFSFVQPAATNPTTTTTASFGGFGLFGKPATTTTASSFMGQPVCSPSTFTQNTGSAFGQSAGNIFAQKSSTPTANIGSIFGQSAGGSLFGGTAANTAPASSTASIFGQTASTPFGSSASSTTTKTGSIFGQSSDFGSSPATTTSGSIFGQNTFGNPAATTASSFSFNPNTGPANSGFGTSSGSIFGAKPTFGQAPAFGQPATFGSPSAFGAAPASANVFGSPASPTQSSGTFGGGFSSPSAFGQKPVFGSPPNFGQGSFGAAPAFGSSPSFGSPQFGQGSASPPGG